MFGDAKETGWAQRGASSSEGQGETDERVGLRSRRLLRTKKDIQCVHAPTVGFSCLRQFQKECVLGDVCECRRGECFPPSLGLQVGDYFPMQSAQDRYVAFS